MNIHIQWLGGAGSLLGFLAVALGAFGAHGLKTRLTPDDLAIFETAVRYQMYHALAILLVVSLLMKGEEWVGPVAGWAFVGGIVVFSGSLYLMLSTGQRWLGAVTPLGGLAFLLGWAVLAWGFLQPRGG